MKDNNKADRQSQSATEVTGEDGEEQETGQLGHGWEFVEKGERILGDNAEPDQLFFLESWTIGVSRAIENWQQRRQEAAEPDYVSATFCKPDIVGRGSLTSQRVFYKEYIPSARESSDSHEFGFPSHRRIQEDLSSLITEAQRITPHTISREKACQILGVTACCTRQEVKAAYRRKIIQWHPDRLGPMTKDVRMRADEQMAAINEAYTFLRMDSI